MRVLLPILSQSENDEKFLEKAFQGVKEAVVLLVVDRNAMTGLFGFAATEIMQGNKMVEEIADWLKGEKIKSEEVIEWGDTALKIEHVAKLKKADKIVLKKQSNQYFKQLVEKLEKEKGARIELQVV